MPTMETGITRGGGSSYFYHLHGFSGQMGIGFFLPIIRFFYQLIKKIGKCNFAIKNIPICSVKSQGKLTL